MDIRLAVATLLLGVQITGICAQVLEIFRLKDTRNVSLPALLLFYGGMTHSLAFIYGDEAPLPYQVGFGIITALVGIMVIQVMLYTPGLDRRRTGALAAGLTISGLTFFLLPFLTPYDGTNVAGWIMFGTSTIRSIPQILQIERTRNTAGISVFNLITEAVTGTIHLGLCISFGLSLQMIFGYIRLLTCALIQLMQCARYRHSHS